MSTGHSAARRGGFAVGAPLRSCPWVTPLRAVGASRSGLRSVHRVKAGTSGPAGEPRTATSVPQVTAPTSEVEPPAGSDQAQPATGPDGLSAAEVAERVARGQVNAADERTSRTIGEI